MCFTRCGTALWVLVMLALAPILSAQSMFVSVEDFIASAAKADPEQRVRLRGTVTTFLGTDMLFLQDASAGALVCRTNVASEVKINDLVEVGGIPSGTGAAPHLLCMSLRVIEAGKTPAPLDLDPRVTPSSDSYARLVRVRTRVAGPNASQPEGRQVLIDAFGSVVPVIFEGPEPAGKWPTLGAGDVVEGTGVLILRKGSSSPYRIIAPSRSSLIRIAAAPWWVRNRSALIAGGVAFSGFAILAAGFALRRRKPAQPAPLPEPKPEPAPHISDADRRYHELFASATDVVLTHDLDGVITAFNPAGERLLGWSAREIIGRPIYSIMAPAEAEIAGGLVRPTRPTDTPWGASFHIELKTRDGRAVPFEVNSWIEFQDGEAVGVQAICRNISQRLRSEDERLRFERKLQETQKLESLGILAGGIAHDFNNLLTAILGNASLAKLELAPDSPTVKSLDEIEMAADRASELCAQMLAYAGQGRFIVSRVDLSAVVMETLELMQASVSKRAKLELHLAEKLPPVHGDTAQLRQVLMNLVTNASEALGEGHGTITIRTSRVSAEPAWLIDAQLVPEIFEGEYVMLEITDTGCGMNPEVASRMFEPFFTTKFTGRGLGLAAVLGIARSHRGALKVESRLGQGTSFQLALPAIGVFPTGGASGGDAEARPLFHATVLAVDDEAPVRRTVTRALEMLGCKVVAAEDGVVALQRVRQYGRPFDLVLLDLTMPQMDGVETLRELRRLRPDLPVILMSGFAQTQAMARFGEHRLAGFLQKPFKLDDLSRLVGRVLTEQQGPFANLR